MKKIMITVALLTTVPVMAVSKDAAEKESLYSESSKLTVANINKTTEVLRDPSTAAPNLQKRLKRISGEARSRVDDVIRSMDQQASEQKKKDKINDPTKMSGSFRAALGNMTVRQTTTLTTTGAPPDLPEISLAAIVYGNDEHYHAMLHVDDRTVLIREGDKATFIDDNKLIEIVVQEITRSDVRLAVYPSNQLIVLR